MTNDDPAINNPRFRFFGLYSELLARCFENRTSCFPKMGDHRLKKELDELEEQLQILHRFNALKLVQRFDELGKHNVLVIRLNASTGIDLELKRYGSRRLAIKSVQELEQASTITDGLHVGAATAADLRSAFRNFFRDAKEFCKKTHTARNAWKPL